MADRTKNEMIGNKGATGEPTFPPWLEGTANRVAEHFAEGIPVMIAAHRGSGRHAVVREAARRAWPARKPRPWHEHNLAWLSSLPRAAILEGWGLPRESHGGLVRLMLDRNTSRDATPSLLILDNLGVVANHGFASEIYAGLDKLLDAARNRRIQLVLLVPCELKDRPVIPGWDVYAADRVDVVDRLPPPSLDDLVRLAECRRMTIDQGEAQTLIRAVGANPWRIDQLLRYGVGRGLEVSELVHAAADPDGPLGDWHLQVSRLVAGLSGEEDPVLLARRASYGWGVGALRAAGVRAPRAY